MGMKREDQVQSQSIMVFGISLMWLIQQAYVLLRVYRLIVKNEIMLPVAIFNLKWGAYGLGIEML